MFERHDVMQTPHQRYADYCIAKPATDDRESHQFDIDVVGHEEMETTCIDSHTNQTYCYQFIYVESPVLQP